MREPTFPFVHLAAELRELIYLELLQTKTLLLTNNLHLEAHNLPSTPLLLLNCHFHAEYSSLSSKKSLLIINDSPRATKNPNSFSLALPPQARKIEKVQFNLACTHFTKDAVAELDFHHTWTRQILGQLDRCSAVRIDIHLAAGVKAKEYEAALNWSGYWCDLAALKELRVWRVERGSTAWSFNSTSKKLVLQWDPKSRLLQRTNLDLEGEQEVFANVWLNTVQRRRES